MFADLLTKQLGKTLFQRVRGLMGVIETHYRLVLINDIRFMDMMYFLFSRGNVESIYSINIRNYELFKTVQQCK